MPESGHIRFRVKGASAGASVISRRSIDDGKYHLVTCYRKRGEIGVIVDGRRGACPVKHRSGGMQ